MLTNSGASQTQKNYNDRINEVKLTVFEAEAEGTDGDEDPELSPSHIDDRFWINSYFIITSFS